MKYLSIVVVSVLAMMFVSVYLYMAYTVSRLTDSLGRFALLQAKDLKDESCRFWLEDKVESPNRFQRHFNLILMIKDVYVCILLLALYKQVPLMLILLLIQQTVFFFLALANPPYRVGWNNKVMLATQGLYILLDIAFLINVLAKLTSEQRYFYVGFMMIAIVLVIILVNMLVGMYYQGKETYLRCKKKREAAKIAAEKNSANTHLPISSDLKPNSLVMTKDPQEMGATLAMINQEQSEMVPVAESVSKQTVVHQENAKKQMDSIPAQIRRRKIYNNKKVLPNYQKETEALPKSKNLA